MACPRLAFGRGPRGHGAKMRLCHPTIRRFEARLLPDRSMCAVGQERDERTRRLRRGVGGQHRGAVDDQALQRRRQQAHQRDAGDRDDLAHRIDADLGLARGDALHAAVERVAVGQLVLERRVDTELLRDLGEVDAARRRVRIGVHHRARVQERVLERFRRRDVGMRRAFAHDDADADAAEHAARRRPQRAGLDQRVDRADRHEHHVGRRRRPRASSASR